MIRAGHLARALAALAAAALGAGCSKAGPPPLPTCADAANLRCTGLYRAGAVGSAPELAAGVAPFTPGFRLWSDGLEKARYVYLPPGTRIDTADPDEWTFPVGTKLWKEFRWRGRRIETRFLEKTAPGSWRRATFVWNAAQTEAREEAAGRTVVLDGHGPYDIPGREDCGRCHGGRRDDVLGFEALALAAPGAAGLTLARLVAENRLTQPPPATAVSVPGTALDQQALGWLHMNCGVSCHNANPEAGASFAGLNLKLEVGRGGGPAQAPALRTALGRPTTALGFRDPAAPRIRIHPGDPAGSAVFVRAASRKPALAMPPLASHLADHEALALLERWIATLPAEAPPGRAAP